MDTRMGAQLAALVAGRKYSVERDRQIAEIDLATEFDKVRPSLEEISSKFPKWEELSLDSRRQHEDTAREILCRVGEKVDFVTLMKETDEIAGNDAKRIVTVAAEATYDLDVERMQENGFEMRDGRLYPEREDVDGLAPLEEPEGIPARYRDLDEHEKEGLSYVMDESVLKSLQDLHQNPVIDVKEFMSIGNERYTHDSVGSKARELDEVIGKGFYEEGIVLPVRADFMDSYLEWCGKSDLKFVCTFGELQDLLAPDGGIVHLVNPEPRDALMSEKFFRASQYEWGMAYTLVDDAFSYVLHNGLSASFRGTGLYDPDKEPVFRYSPEGFLESATLGERKIATTDVVEAYFEKTRAALPSLSPQDVQQRAELLKTLEPQVMERCRHFRHSAIVAMSECRRSYEEALRKQRAVQDRNLVPGRDPAEYQRYREGLVRRDKERSEQARGNIVTESAMQERQYTPKNN